MEQLSRRFHVLKNQSGINMVDLMMWLVIAALMLAAAIQGIGYYQKAAYLNNMKLAAYDAGTNAMAVAANDQGAVTEEVVSTAASDTKWTSEQSYSVESTSTSPYIRVTSAGVNDKEAIYLFEACGDYAVGVNVVPTGGTHQLQECGVAATAPTGGGAGQTSGYSVAETADAIAYNNVTDVASGMNPLVIKYLNNEIRAYADKTIIEYDQAAFDATAFSSEYYNSFPMRTGAKVWTDMYNVLSRTDNPQITALRDKAWNDAYDVYWNAIDAQLTREEADPSAKNDLTEVKSAQRAYVDALSEFYRAAAAVPVESIPMVTSASDPDGLKDKIVTAGSDTVAKVTFDTPASLDVAHNQDRFSFYTVLFNKNDSPYAMGGSTYRPVTGDPYTFAVNGNSVTFQGTWQPPRGSWQAGNTEFLVGVKDNTTGIVYYSTFNVIGQ